MRSITGFLGEVFGRHNWSVPPDLPRPLAEAGFLFTAENDVAVALAATASASTLGATAVQASGEVATLLQSYEGPKAWEVYLLLAVEGLAGVDDDTIVLVQRDLMFCRKIILDADAILNAERPVAYLEGKLALLFPLAEAETEPGPSPRALLESNLVEKGHALGTVRTLMNGLDEAGFDPIPFLITAPPPHEA